MSQPTWTFIRVVNKVLRYMRKPTITDVNSTSNSRVAQDVIETIKDEYQELCSRQDWSWLRSSAYLTVEAEEITTGTFTNGTAAAVVGVLPSYGDFNDGEAAEGQVSLRADAFDETYIVQPNSSNLIVLLDRAFNGESAVGAAVTIFKDRYDLPSNFGRFLTLQKHFSDTDIHLVGMQEFRSKQFETIGSLSYGGSIGPRYATLTEEKEIVFWPWPKEKRSYLYDFIRVPDELSGNEATFAIPQDDMSVLLHRVMMLMYAYIEDDTRAGTAAQMYIEKYNEMSGSKTQVDDGLQLHVINEDRARFSRARRGRYGYSKGKFFDRS